LQMSQKIVAEILLDVTTCADQNFPHPEAKKSFHQGNYYDQSCIKR